MSSAPHISIPMMKPKIIFIGFNKCATRSFNELFRRNGLRSCHWKIPGEEQTIAEKIVSNISLARRSLAGLEHFVVFSDLTSLNKNCFIDMPLLLPFLIDDYPNSYFIYQYRSLDKWIESRLKHANFRKRSSQVLGGASESEVVDFWKNQFIIYRTYVRRRMEHCNYMEFELEAEPVNELASFLSQDYQVDVSHWSHKGKSV